MHVLWVGDVFLLVNPPLILTIDEFFCFVEVDEGERRLCKEGGGADVPEVQG